MFVSIYGEVGGKGAETVLRDCLKYGKIGMKDKNYFKAKRGSEGRENMHNAYRVVERQESLAVLLKFTCHVHK